MSQVRLRRLLAHLVLPALLVLLAAAAVPFTRAAQSSDTQAATAAQLEALSGEYASAAFPDIPLSFYVKDGKLTVESESRVPAQLDSISPLEFQFPHSKTTIRFLLDVQGHGESAIESTSPDEVLHRSGPAVQHVFHDYQRFDFMIPARDGVKLHAVILKPADIAAPLPFLIQRTPYGCDGATRESFFGGRPELAREGYIYACADIRGRYKSEGKFIMSRPLADHHDPKAVDESTDTWDTVDWLLKNVSGNNGRAGFVGTSYPGFLAMMAGIDPHPAVRATPASISAPAPLQNQGIFILCIRSPCRRDAKAHPRTLPS